MITASVVTVTTRRVVQLMPRPAASQQRSQGECFASSSIIASGLSMLANELDANRLAAAPHYCAVAPRSGVARERQSETGRQHDQLLSRDFRTGCGQILHDARACREATFEGDPSGLAQRFARVPRLYFCVHFSCSTAYSAKRDTGFTNTIRGSR